ncbi:MAG TPA: alpha/beta fold hydrolase [Gammaproteobacteria bacterium]
MLDAIEITTGEMPKLAVLWLHGLGADGHDFEPIVPELRLGLPVRFVFPHAPVRPVTINGGMQMRAWYDILGFGRHVKEDAAGIRASAAAVTELVDREIERGMSSDRIVLAGFSQGGAIALHTALREPRRLAGVLALSTYLPLSATLASERSAANAGIPLFMAHGTDDPVLPLSLAELSRRALEALGYAVDWHAYPMAHSVCMEEVNAIGAWLAALPAARG